MGRKRVSLRGKSCSVENVAGEGPADQTFLRPHIACLTDSKEGNQRLSSRAFAVGSRLVVIYLLALNITSTIFQAGYRPHSLF